nr:MAG TPA: replisome organizer [Caudoviricetes sp.]
MENSWIRLHRKLMDDPLYFAEPFTKMQAWIDLLLLANFADRVTFIRGNRVTIKRGQVAYSREWFSGRWRWSRGRVERFLSMLENDRKIVQRKSHIISIVTIVNYDFYQKTECATNDTTEIGCNYLNISSSEKTFFSDDTTDSTTDRATDSTTENASDDTTDSTTENRRKSLCINRFKNVFCSDGTTDETTESTTDGTQHNNIYIDNNNNKKEKNKIKKESAAEFVRPSTAEVAAYMAAQGTPIDAARFVDYYEAKGWSVGNAQMRDWRAVARMWARIDVDRAAEAAKKEAERRQREAEREKARAERPQIIIQKTERYGNGTNPTAAPATNSTPPPGGWRTRERDDERAERDRRFANYLARLAAETADDGGSPGL